MTYRINRAGAGVVLASMAGGVFFMIFRSPFPCGAGTGEGCAKASLLGPIAYVLMYLVAFCFSVAIAAFVVAPMAIALEHFRRLTLLPVNLLAATAGLATAHFLEGLSLAAALFFAGWFVVVATCFWRIATR